MARSNISDVLQVYPFWLFDVAPIEGISLPIFNPLAGFSSCTAPGMTFEMHDITEGNWHFRRKVIKKAEVDSMTLTRGVTFSNSDFWRWTVASLTGRPEGFQPRFLPGSLMSIGGPTPRRNLLLIQFFSRSPLGSLNAGASAALSVFGVSLGGRGFATSTPPFGPFDSGIKSPRIPAKAWLLHDCLPTRFKTGSDFDASSGDVSISEIEFQPEMFEEISLSA